MYRIRAACAEAVSLTVNLVEHLIGQQWHSKRTGEGMVNAGDVCLRGNMICFLVCYHIYQWIFHGLFLIIDSGYRMYCREVEWCMQWK